MSMGFRDPEWFNRAFLSKQAWRLVTSPDLLLTRILNAHYFPRSSFFTNDLGDRPSLTLRSILSTRESLTPGLRMWIGNSVTVG